jgi:branched-chain amino acid transport system permease protein
LFWLLPAVVYFAFPRSHLLLSQIAITALFTLSLDLILGYAGIVPLGLRRFDLAGRTAYLYAVATLFVMLWIARRLVHSPFGMGLRGIRQNALRMPALGTPVHRRLMAVYVLGTAHAGVAGARLAQTTQFVSIDVFSFSRSA